MTRKQDGRAYSRRALNRLRRPGGGLEGTTAAPDLSDARIRSSLQIARERFREIAERSKADASVTADQQRVLADAATALSVLATEGEAAQLTNRQRVGLEAIVIPDGTRPALFVREDDVDPNVAESGTWQGRLSALRTAISTVAQSVGRINAEVRFPNYAGTGWVVGEGLILTNKHVLEFLVGGPDPRPDGSWEFLKPVTIDFLAEFGSTETRAFEITGVKYASPDRINGVLRPSNLDVAVLTARTGAATGPLPPPIPIFRPMKGVATQAEVYVMGYPARPNDEFGEVLMRVFQDEYFVKRFAPGLVEAAPDDFDDGGHHRVFTHDSSTLGGNSGSCVIEFRVEGKAAVGLHFGGLARQENYAHSLPRLEAELARHGVTFA